MAGQLPNGLSYPYSEDDLLKIIVYDANGKPTYMCKARPGTLSSETGWQIRSFTYDASDNLTHIKFAGGSNLYDKVADDYATYSYS